MVSNLEARVSQQFKSKYERIVRMLRLKTDELIDDYQSNRILPYQLFSKLNQLLIEAAIELSHKRLELDCAELGKFDFTPREKVEWLKSNQFDCLFNKFREGIVLDIYINQIHKIASGGFGSQSQMHPELRNIYNQIEREIEVMCLEPPIKEKQQVVMNNYNYQNNNGVIIHSEGQSRNTINVTYMRDFHI